MIGIHPEIRIELARHHRDDQIEAARVRQIEVEAAPAPRRRSARVAGRVVPRLRPQQSRQ
jgi:hypothetical protein